MNTVRILFVGDVVGLTGRMMFQKHISRIKQEHRIDAIIVNGENSTTEGRGITPRIVRFFRHNHADVVTTGNHIWKNREIYGYWDKNATDLIRPANFPSGSPGIGMTTFTTKNNGVTIAVMNIQGRTFMGEQLSCPFRAADSLIPFLQSKTKLIYLDFHAETTSEKAGMAYYVDGRISGIVGTHTHVQTADERVLPGGTGFITDLGMVGSRNSMLGMKKEPIIQQFLTQMPVKYMVDTAPPVILCGVIMETDVTTGKTISIERIQVIDEKIQVGADQDLGE